MFLGVVRPLQFDEVAASILTQALAEASQSLAWQAGWRRQGALEVLRDFEGAHAVLFEQGCLAEQDDRCLLVSVLDDLIEQVKKAVREAERERDRRAKLAAWERREQVRQERARADALVGMGDFGQLLTLPEQHEMYDPKPSEVPIRPTPIAAGFRARQRPRWGGASSGGRSSADPDILRSFAAQTRGSNQLAEQELVRVKCAWVDFQAYCAWVPIEDGSFVTAYEDLLAENLEDAQWLERIADAFDSAGGAVSDVTLGWWARSQTPSGFAALLRPGLTPAEVGDLWEKLGLTAADVQALAAEIVSWRDGHAPPALEALLTLGDLPGLPATIQDIAARATLTAAENHPLEVFRFMGFRDQSTVNGLTRGAPKGARLIREAALEPMCLEEFKAQIAALRVALAQADNDAKNLPGGPRSKVAQLMGFGVHDNAVVAAVSLGDLDTAQNVTINVPGATSSLKDSASNMLSAGRDMFSLVRKNSNGESVAHVSWLGYRAPEFTEVPWPSRADSGAERLASSIDGIFESRATPPRSSTVQAHSMGSTTAAEAMKITQHQVSNFSVYGSAGFLPGTTVEDIHADRVFATEGSKDNIAWMGCVGNDRINPVEMPGVQVFSSENQGDLLGVTDHLMYADEEEMEKTGKIGYLSPDTTSQDALASISAKGEVR